MLSLLEMLQTVPVAAESAVLLTAAAESSTGKAQPKILLQVTFVAMRESYSENAFADSTAVSEDVPEAAMGPVASCSSMRVCSHAVNSSSHALTSD